MLALGAFYAPGKISTCFVCSQPIFPALSLTCSQSPCRSMTASSAPSWAVKALCASSNGPLRAVTSGKTTTAVCREKCSAACKASAAPKTMVRIAQRDVALFSFGANRRTDLPRGEQNKRQPECRRRQQRPFVKRQLAEPALPAAFAHCCALDLIADECEICADFRVARREQRRPPIRGDGFAEMAGLEFRVAHN